MPAKKQRRAPKRADAEAFSQIAAALERIEQQNRATIDAMSAVERRLNDWCDARFKRIELRLDALEIAVRQNSDDIRQNARDIAGLQRGTARLAEVLGGNCPENALASVEARAGVGVRH